MSHDQKYSANVEIKKLYVDMGEFYNILLLFRRVILQISDTASLLVDHWAEDQAIPPDHRYNLGSNHNDFQEILHKPVR